MARIRTVRHKNITRVDHEGSRTHGYNVRIMWQGERRSKPSPTGAWAIASPH